MEQRTLPPEEIRTPLDTSHPLLSETAEGLEASLPASLPTMEATQVEVLGADLSRLVKQKQKRADRAVWSIPAFYGLMVVILLLMKTLLGERGTALLSSSYTYIPFGLFWAGIFGFMARNNVKSCKKLRSMAQTLAASGDIRATGPLIDTLGAEDEELHQIAMEGLIKLLPRLQATDAPLLNATQRALLCGQLRRTPKRPVDDRRLSAHAAHQRAISFRITVLWAFAYIGDSSALPTVQRLAQGKATTEEERCLQEAARECLPLLKLRIEQQSSNQTLLRASAASDTGAETLLRPAQGAQETPSDQLLRSADCETHGQRQTL